MAIQWRQGNEADFDESKMISGEGAVFLDTQKAFIAFAPNSVKQLMTTEEAEVYVSQTKEYRDETEGYRDETKALKDSAVNEVTLAKTEAINTFDTSVGTINTLKTETIAEVTRVKDVAIAESNSAITQVTGVKNSAISEVNSAKTEVINLKDETKGYRDKAKEYSEEAFSGTPEGYLELVKNVYSLPKKEGTDLKLENSKEGRVLLHRIEGKSIQNGTPTPDNPIEIVSVGDSANLNATPYYEASKTAQGLNWVLNNDGTVAVSGTNTSSTSSAFFVCHGRTEATKALSFKKGDTIRVSGGISLNVSLDLFHTNSAGSYESLCVDSGSGATYTFSNDDDTVGLQIRVLKSVTVPEGTAIKPMLVRVNADGTYPTNYRPFGNQLVFEEKGKNLIPFPYYETSRTGGGLTAVADDNGIITVNGTQTGATGLFDFTKYTAQEVLKIDKNKTYAFFNPFKSDIKGQITLGIRWYREDDVISSITGTNTSIGANGDKNGAVIRSGFSYVYIYLYTYNSSKTFSNLKFAPMFVEVNEDGTYPTDYESYKHNLITCPIEPLRSIGDVKDELIKVDGGFDVVRRIDYFVPTTATWAVTRGDSSQINVSAPNGISLEDTGLILNRFVVDQSSGVSHIPGKCFLGSTGSICFHTYETDIDTIAKATQWLLDNPVEIAYVLKTPTIEHLTNEQANILLSLSSYEDTTYINQDMNVKGDMEIEYATSRASALALTGTVNAEINAHKLADLTTAMLELTSQEEGI